jgi:hypothetical protein
MACRVQGCGFHELARFARSAVREMITIQMRVCNCHALYRNPHKKAELSRSDQHFLRVIRRPKAIGPASEVALAQNGCRYMLDFLKAGFAGQSQHLYRREEADERRTTGSRPFLCHLKPVTHLRVGELDR